MKRSLKLSSVLFFSAIVISCNNAYKPKEAAGLNVPVVIQNKGVNIAYTNTGKGDTTLLFIHGWAINKSYWTNQVAHFAKRYRAVTMDLPGFGVSGKNRNKWDTKTYSSDVNAVINALDLKKVILVGHSMAGDIALEAAAQNPEPIIGLIGVDNFKNVGEPLNPDAKTEFAAAITEMKRHFKKLAFQYFNSSLFSKTTPKAVKERILNDVAKTDSAVAIASMEQQDLGYDEAGKLQQAGKKLYLINSDTSPTVIKYMAAKHIPFKVYYTKGTGHYAMVESPDEFNGILEQIIEDMGHK